MLLSWYSCSTFLYDPSCKCLASLILASWSRGGRRVFFFSTLLLLWRRKKMSPLLFLLRSVLGGWLLGCMAPLWVVWVPAFIDLSSQAGKGSEIYTTAVIFLLMPVGFSVNREKLTIAFLIWFCRCLGKLRFLRALEDLWISRDSFLVVGLVGVFLVGFFCFVFKFGKTALHSFT